MLNFQGRFVPLITPFTDDGFSLSEVRLARLVRALMRECIDGFVLNTESGEFTSLTFNERKQLLEITIREANGAIPVVMNVSSLSTPGSLDLAQHAQRAGARAVVLMPPYYGSFTQEEIEAHIRTVALYASLPVMLVDTAYVLEPETRASLANLSNVWFAEPSLGRHWRTDDFTLGHMVVSPEFHLPIVPGLSELMAQHGTSRTLKAAFSLMDLEVGPTRPPMMPLNPHAWQTLRQLSLPSLAA